MGTVLSHNCKLALEVVCLHKCDCFCYFLFYTIHFIIGNCHQLVGNTVAIKMHCILSVLILVVHLCNLFLEYSQI